MTELDVALSIDDALYRKFEDLNRQLQERVERFNARQRIAKVCRRVGKIDVRMKILEVYETDKGLMILVE